MRIPGRRPVSRQVRWLRSRFGRRAVILGYHRIAENSWDPYSLNVSPSRFAEHLEVIRERANPTRLSELVRGLEQDRLPPRAVVVTFDDAYTDVLYCAKPLLERAGVPATVFVITGMVGREPWWDELARIVSPAAASSGDISIPLPRSVFRWPSSVAGDDERRAKLLQALQRELQPLADGARQEALARLRESLADGKAEPVTHRCLDADELRALAEGDTIEVGAHSDTHPELTALTLEEQQREITRSKAVVEELVARPVRTFSYPHGCSSAETRRIVRDSGYSGACGSVPDVSRARSDPFALPRFFVSDVDGATFASWLSWWLGN